MSQEEYNKILQEDINKEIAQRSTPTMNFFNVTQKLSDVTVTDPVTEKEYKLHRAILASKSNYFKEKFVFPDSPPDRIALPYMIRPNLSNLNVSLQKNTNVFQTILNTIYNEMNLDDLKKGLEDPLRSLDFYSYLKVLQIPECQKFIENFIEQNIANFQYSVDLMINGIKMDEESFQQKAAEIISKEFEQIKNDQDKFKKIISIPMDAFLKIIKNDNIKIDSEDFILSLVQNYIQERESHELSPEDQEAEKLKEEPKKEEKPAQEGEQPKEEQKASEETKAPEEPKKEEPKPEEPKPEEIKEGENKEGENAQQPQTEKPQAPLTIENLEKPAEQRLTIFKLTQAKKKQLLDAVRLQYCSHQELIKASKDETFKQFKEVFLNAISSKLDMVEATHVQESAIKPRESYKDKFEQYEDEKQKSQKASQKEPIDKQSQLRQELNYQQQIQNNMPQYQQQGNNRSYQANQNNQYMNNPLQNPNQNQGHPQQNQNQYQQNQSMNNSQLQQQYMNQRPISVVNPYEQQQYDEAYRMQSQQGMRNSQNQQQQQQQQGGSSMYSPDRNNPNLKPPQKIDSRTLQDIMLNKPILENKSIEFVYEYDFDQNGVIYYLGTQGYKQAWQNPHRNGMLKVKMSSQRTGNIEDFVGREPSNCGTQNERNSWMGVDLGVDRYVIPTVYTIRNRNSTTHVMLNWVFEASNNESEWHILDTRIHFDPQRDQYVEKGEDLRIRGFTSTYLLDDNIVKLTMENIPQQIPGFRFFRLRQLSKNSNQSDNMHLSGFEVYGEAYGPTWNF